MKALLDFSRARRRRPSRWSRIGSRRICTITRQGAPVVPRRTCERAEPVTRARLLLARAAQIVLRNGLTMLGISAPERM